MATGIKTKTLTLFEGYFGWCVLFLKLRPKINGLGDGSTGGKMMICWLALRKTVWKRPIWVKMGMWWFGCEKSDEFLSLKRPNSGPWSRHIITLARGHVGLYRPMRCCIYSLWSTRLTHFALNQWNVLKWHQSWWQGIDKKLHVFFFPRKNAASKSRKIFSFWCTSKQVQVYPTLYINKRRSWIVQ